MPRDKKSRAISTTTSAEPLSIAVRIETTDERPPDWESVWRELLLKLRTSSETPIPAPPPQPSMPPAAPPPSTPAPTSPDRPRRIHAENSERVGDLP